MNNQFQEKNKLPLTFKYVEVSKNKNVGKLNSKIIYYLKCQKYQTDFLVRLHPFKPLTRML